MSAFAVFIYGVTQLDWDMSQAGAVSFLAGVFAGIVGRLGLNGTAEGFVEGFSSMAFGALLIGFARAIYIVLSTGHVVDTLVAAMFAPLAHLPIGPVGGRDGGRANRAAFPGAEREWPGSIDDAHPRPARGSCSDCRGRWSCWRTSTVRDCANC